MRRTAHRALLVATAAMAAGICTALLISGHQAQRMRSAKPETLDGMLMRDLPAAVSCEGR
ncbi:hypothetical protein Ahu01nite_080790 [Winogradskya humida]|uniref:Uncharacterized protein n=2 Tax=Winogradskya humida TaxID=113566 RepID=A0ABQ4A2A1_9ACTN|nr:hypothetical protein Ahu01nite_080790 [Actinoplanes humidus]